MRWAAFSPLSHTTGIDPGVAAQQAYTYRRGESFSSTSLHPSQSNYPSPVIVDSSTFFPWDVIYVVLRIVEGQTG